jgi:hypothetical protein
VPKLVRTRQVLTCFLLPRAGSRPRRLLLTDERCLRSASQLITALTLLFLAPKVFKGATERGFYAANLSAACDRLRNPDQLRRSHVAPPAPHGVKPAEALIAIG